MKILYTYADCIRKHDGFSDWRQVIAASADEARKQLHAQGWEPGFIVSTTYATSDQCTSA